MQNRKQITALSESPWQDYLACSETQLYHYFEPEQGIFLAESPNVIARAVSGGYQPLSFLIDTTQLSAQTEQILSQFPDVPVYLAEPAVMNSVSGVHLTRGVLCAMRRRPAAYSPDLTANAHRIAVLENVMNPTNLGAIFRSAAALGMDAVLLTSGCTDPLYRRSARVSMGTVFQVPWGYLPDAPDAAQAVAMLRGCGFVTAAMALRDDSVSIADPRLGSAEKLAVVLGTEGEGLSDATISACDHTVRIPMSHGVDSLNVAAASAVAFWALRKQPDGSC